MSEQRLNNINPPKEKFVFTNGTQLHDQKFETKPVGYFKDAFRRFCKNKGSVVGAIIIGILIIFAIIGRSLWTRALKQAIRRQDTFQTTNIFVQSFPLWTARAF
ncbi:MAG: hypothetical protein IKD14_03985 [Clostridia bacterium]|nr:hypothetical protein [Clostridia bacterium]